MLSSRSRIDLKLTRWLELSTPSTRMMKFRRL